MFEISWSELFILALVTILFVKPKDLPYFFNTLGRYVGEMKRQASEFRRQFEDAMREAEMDNLRKELGEVQEEVRHSLDELGDLSEYGPQERTSSNNSSSHENSGEGDSSASLPKEPLGTTDHNRLPHLQSRDP